ncbi:TadE/TadG family type IV pilus assembly protein [Magnetospirillum fulvum]|uniref:TadE-like domain-containing protein n=1 Tax=Magnetospirillum fulvum MGU-K5 TaxID=1316936 RepID=S9SAR5_MAGFU|nr:TadE family protein [Magnetospirillum fulvum]EPY01123.1 hypothetical protein K678_12484 [Magnetospirillum fulvum MGU-K5]
MTQRLFRLGVRGSVGLEFAFLIPILLLLTAGTMEVGVILMTDASLEIAVHDAARYGMATSSIADGNRDQIIRNTVTKYMRRWVESDDQITITTKSYKSFSNVGQPEPVNSVLHPDGTCTASCVPCTGSAVTASCDYVDVNANGHWDADMGASGAGGTGDIVVYSVNVTRPSFTGVIHLAGLQKLTFSRSLVIQNE